MNTPTPPPWYKQFWPWLLISIPAATAVAGIATIWIASSEPVALVYDDYYKKGLGVNRNLASQRAAAERELTAHFIFDFDKQSIQAQMAGDAGTDEMELAFIHPLQMNRDQTVVLLKQGDGSFLGELPVDADRWYLQLEGNPGHEVWRLDGEVDLRKTTAVVLQAGES